MQHTISPSDDGHYVTLTITGEFTADEMLAASAQAHRFAGEHGIFRLLCDVTSGRNRDTTRSNYEFARNKLSATIPVDARMRVAILLSPDDPSHDFPKVAIEAAGHNVSFFTSRDDAMAYLG